MSVAAPTTGASPAGAAVSGSIDATGLNSPGATVAMGSHLWVSDHVNGFCRLDNTTATGKFTINLATCSTAQVGAARLRPRVTIVRDTVSTGAAVDYSTDYVAPDGKLQPWTPVTDLALNPAGGLFVSHDATNGGTNGSLVSTLP